MSRNLLKNLFYCPNMNPLPNFENFTLLIKSETMKLLINPKRNQTNLLQKNEEAVTTLQLNNDNIKKADKGGKVVVINTQSSLINATINFLRQTVNRFLDHGKNIEIE